MESEWRFNVALYAMTNSSWQYCARMLVSVPGTDFLLVKHWNEEVPYVYYALPAELPVLIGALGKFGVHFPYGWGPAIEPD